MTLNEKREIVSKNKDPSIAALNAVLDDYYDLISPVLNEKGNVKTALFKDSKAEQFAVGIQNDTLKYEELRKKIQNNEELSEKEISLLGVAFYFILTKTKRLISDLEKSIPLYEELVQDFIPEYLFKENSQETKT